jgi:hypothetical protein
MQIDNFEKLIEVGHVEPKYNPNETPLKVIPSIFIKQSKTFGIMPI